MIVERGCSFCDWSGEADVDVVSGVMYWDCGNGHESWEIVYDYEDPYYDPYEWRQW